MNRTSMKKDRKQLLQLFLLLGVVSSLFYSCKKDMVRGAQMQVHVVNASVGSGSIELLQNLRSIGSFSYLTGLSANAAYRNVDSGFNDYRLRLSNTELAKWFFTNTSGRYSFFICDTATSSKLKYFFLEDAFDTTGLGKQSKIRLVHTSPDADVLELLTTKPSNLLEDSVLVSERAYDGNATATELATTSTFQNFYADTTVFIKLRKKTSGAILKQYQLQFTKGAVYSILVKGYAAKTDADSLSLSVIKHN
ncbi:hypothetical protein ESA94_00130 [Lacibacter luteus]|uniref:DUF4397 domain-containing protein n=1 Tax=Lacibacter luteus TaxID=2508719 RepID=A0A4V1M7T4_9BACT|nr:DUF4397 domain-containing protein [Lacibacter luteus]RXK61462.1 hypothetical protein ESA94_00130 [Lacibacter luteus]